MTKRRGCGLPIAGGIYIRVGLSPFGKPVEHFLMDPPIRVPSALGLPTQGQLVKPRPGNPDIFDIYDMVGAEHYPHVADVIEEIRHMGGSRRAPSSLDFSLIGPESRLILAHSRAIINNPKPYYDEIASQLTHGSRSPWRCIHPPDKKPAPPQPHPDLDELRSSGAMCGSLWYEDVGPWVQTDDTSRLLMRGVGDTIYHARFAPKDADRSASLGFFASFPVSHITVIRDPEGGKHVKSAAVASKARVPVVVDDE